jgi:arylsulfatase A-like enzyme
MKGGGKKTAALVEFVDLYPTLLELAELNIPDYLEGTSFAAVLNDPAKEWKKAAFSQFPRGRDNEGYTIRTSEWRYTEWRSKKGGKPLFVELYHCAKDPIETRNLAEDPKHKDRREQMKNLLQKGWKNALPPGITNPSNNPRGVDSFYALPKDNRTIELKKIKEMLISTSKNRTAISR